VFLRKAEVTLTNPLEKHYWPQNRPGSAQLGTRIGHIRAKPGIRTRQASAKPGTRTDHLSPNSVKKPPFWFSQRPYWPQNRPGSAQLGTRIGHIRAKPGIRTRQASAKPGTRTDHLSPNSVKKPPFWFSQRPYWPQNRPGFCPTRYQNRPHSGQTWYQNPPGFSQTRY
jgi:hypothetical protein